MKVKARSKADQRLPKRLALSQVHLGRLFGRSGSPILVQLPSWRRRSLLTISGCWWWSELTLDTNQQADQTIQYLCFKSFQTCNQLPHAFSESLHPCTPVLNCVKTCHLPLVISKASEKVTCPTNHLESPPNLSLSLRKFWSCIHTVQNKMDILGHSENLQMYVQETIENHLNAALDSENSGLKCILLNISDQT